MNDIITLSKVRNGVTRKLATSFPEMDIYDEEITEGLEPPSFFVELLKSKQTQELGRRYRREHMFCVHYFDPTRSNTEMHDIAEQLYDVLEYIEVDRSKFRGLRMDHKVEKQILLFFVDYDMLLYRPKRLYPKMKKLEKEVIVRGKLRRN